MKALRLQAFCVNVCTLRKGFQWHQVRSLKSRSQQRQKHLKVSLFQQDGLYPWIQLKCVVYSVLFNQIDIKLFLFGGVIK